MWAPNVYFAYVGLKSVKLTDDARRIARKYMDTVDRNFETTGLLQPVFYREERTRMSLLSPNRKSFFWNTQV